MKCVFDGEDVCFALVTKDCNGCGFRKTEEELRYGRRKAIEKILRKPNANEIIRKYELTPYVDEYREWRRKNGKDLS